MMGHRQRLIIGGHGGRMKSEWLLYSRGDREESGRFSSGGGGRRETGTETVTVTVTVEDGSG